MALFLAFPGNPCNLLQKHVLETLAFSEGHALIEVRQSLLPHTPSFSLGLTTVQAPHFTEAAIHGQLKGVGRSRLAQIQIVTNANAETKSGRLLRSYSPSLIQHGLRIFDFPSFPHASLVVAGSAVLCGSYSFTHRPDFDAAVLVRASPLAERVSQQILADASRSRAMTPADMNVKAGTVKISQQDLFM